MPAGTVEIETASLCAKDALVVMVGGFQAPEYEVKEAGWDLYKYLYNLSERARTKEFGKFLAIKNTSGKLNEVAEADIECLHKRLPWEGNCKKGINCLIFAHSHGAKVVKRALSFVSLAAYLIGEGVPENAVSYMIVHLRKRIAIITFGAITCVPKEYAKVAVNLRHPADFKAIAGGFKYEEKGSCKIFPSTPIVIDSSTNVTVITMPNNQESSSSCLEVSDGSKFEEIETPVDPSAGYTTAESNTRPKSSTSGSLWSMFVKNNTMGNFVVNSGKGLKHLMTEYLEAKFVKESLDKIIKVPVAEGYVPCGCSNSVN